MSTISPNMFLVIPTVGATLGPQYAFDVNNSLTLVDTHDHTPGRGVQITPAGININDDLPLNNHNLTLVRAIQFSSQSSVSDLRAIYVKPGAEVTPIDDLWYRDGNGNEVQITSNGQVNATAASIPGQSYAAGTFIWKQGAGSTTPANFDIGSITLRPNIAATSLGITISPPTTIASQYQVFMPLVPGTGTKFMRLTSSGEMQATVDVDNSTLEVASNTLQVKDAGITQAKLANNSVGTAQIIDQSIITNKLALDLKLTKAQTFTDPSTPSFNVRLVATSNIALSGLAAIDGVTPIAGDKILAAKQTTASDCGVYVAAAGAWSRDTAYDTVQELQGAGVRVTAGAVNANTSWWQNNYLSSIASPQVWSTSSSQLFTVPAGVTQLTALIVGGGGGGGAGGSASGAAGAGQGSGGGGGAGSIPQLVTLSVTPAQIINVTLGAGGAKGLAQPSGGVGLSGGYGGDSRLSSTGVEIVVPGGAGGGGGGTGSASANGSNGLPSVYSANPGLADTTVAGGGGGGAGIGSGGNGGATSGFAGLGLSGGGGGARNATGGAGQISIYCNQQSNGGVAVGSRGGGGGGGSSLAVGGNGGAGFAVGSDAAANTGAGGGGGGGANNISAAVNGGNGGTGKVILFWTSPNP